MKRPIGVVILAVIAFLSGLAQIYRMFVFLGIAEFDYVGQEVRFDEVQLGAALWALLMAAIWFWLSVGLWRLRMYAIRFGIFISLFTLVWGVLSLLVSTTYEFETIPWLLAGAVFLYLSYPGAQRPFVENEMAGTPMTWE